jgi:hypothetical protein
VKPKPEETPEERLRRVESYVRDIRLFDIRGLWIIVAILLLTSLDVKCWHEDDGKDDVHIILKGCGW